VKSTRRAVNVAMFAACLSTVRCGGDTDPSPGEPKADGQGGAGMGGAFGSGGAAGSGFGGFGGFFPDSGQDPRNCPAQRPPDSSPCSTRNMCHYPDGICTCVRAEQDASGREWNCFDTMPRDGGMCPHDPPQDGDVCMNPGLRCQGMTLGIVCTCEATDGGDQWHC
jgi:hypothetical protein